MKISFVIPAYNEEERIGACLEAIRREIETTEDPSTGRWVEAEIIVVNNVSTDKTKEIAERAGVWVVDEPNKGLVWARQAGFAACTGGLVANIDADVILPEGWLHRVLYEFKKNGKLVALSGPFIYTDISIFSRAMVKVFYAIAFLSYLINRFILRVGSMLQGGNFVIVREAMLKAGGYDTSITFYGEDTDVARRLNKVGQVKWTFRLPVYTSGRRFKGEGIILTSMRYTANYFWVTFFGKPLSYKYKDVRPKEKN